MIWFPLLLPYPLMDPLLPLLRLHLVTKSPKETIRLLPAAQRQSWHMGQGVCTCSEALGEPWTWFLRSLKF